MKIPLWKEIRKSTTLALATVLLLIFVAGPVLAATKTIDNVKIEWVGDPTGGVRLIYVSGKQGGKYIDHFLIITEKDYKKLKDCKEGSASLEYDEDSRKVTNVKC